jgi:hypothetical protein
MTDLLVADPRRAASHLNMIEHLPGPFQAGAIETAVPIDDGGRIAIPWASREPALLLAPLERIDDGEVSVEARITPDPPGGRSSLSWARYSEPGSYLLVHRPAIDAATRRAAPFEVALRARLTLVDGTSRVIPVGQIGRRFEARIIEGALGRLIYALGHEQQRIRRMGREVASMRWLELSRDDALDRIGAELGVPRLAEELVTRRAGGTISIITRARREPDAEYRRRLAIYRPFALATRSWMTGMLNGTPATEDDVERPGIFGVRPPAQAFQVNEDDSPFAVAIHLVATGEPGLRDNFLEHIRRERLVWPEDNATANGVHAVRLMTDKGRARVEALRSSLRDGFDLPAGAAIAPPLAIALDRVARCRRALGAANRWRIERLQDATAGSRYELGLGADLRVPPAAQLNALRQAHANRPANGTGDAAIDALLNGMSPRPAAEDPEGRWLLEPCGLATVHRLNTPTVYLSSLPTFGLAITGPVEAPAPIGLEARYHAPGDPGANAALVAGLAAAANAWAALGRPAWAVLPDPQARARWAVAAGRPQGDPALTVLAAAGLPGTADQPAIVARLASVPDELLETIALPPALAGQVAAGNVDAVTPLRDLATVLREAGLAAAQPLVIGPNEVLLVVSVIGLPGSGLNLNDRRSTGFRWYVIPIQGSGGAIGPVGSRTTYEPANAGLAAIVVLGYARRGRADPFEFEVGLPSGVLLSLSDYELLMNVLERAFPIGVEINTSALRKAGVDLDGDGTADPLGPAASRTYRPFRRRRHLGEASVSLEDIDTGDDR